MGPTSHDMVARIRRLLPRKLKVGHTGTLDPFAGGVLVLALGKATRFADEVHRMEKAYRATIRLGAETTTLDPTGEITETAPVPALGERDLETVAASFVGRQAQIPPIFSAKKVAGKRGYQLAREGRAVTLAPKDIQIFELRLTRLDELHLDCRVVCSTGTYIRALGRDLAQALGTRGHLTRLVRTRVGPLTEAQCFCPAQGDLAALSAKLLPVPALLTQWPQIILPKIAEADLLQGRPFLWRQALPTRFLGAFENPDGALSSVFRCEYDGDGLIRPRQLCFRSET